MSRVKKPITAAVAAEKPELDLQAAAQACFDANPEENVFYQTADGQCFKEEGFAKRHAKNLDDQNVNMVFRDGEAEEEGEDEPEA